MAVLASGLLASSAVAAPQATSAEDAARAAITRLEARWLAAVGPDGDRRELATILADDYVDIDWQGRIRHKSDLLQAPPPARDTTQHVSGLQVRVWGDAAVATGVNTVHSTSKGWTVEVPFTDVFARIDGQWRAVSSQETLRRQARPAPAGTAAVRSQDPGGKSSP